MAYSRHQKRGTHLIIKVLPLFWDVYYSNYFKCNKKFALIMKYFIIKEAKLRNI